MLTRRTTVSTLLLTALALSIPSMSHSAPLPDDMALGDPLSKITVVEYASVACPFCGRWDKEVWPSFKAKYVDSHRVSFVYREMLVGSKEEVVVAAAGFLLARCAGEEKYFSVLDAVYGSQPELFDRPRQELVRIAKAFGFDEQQFNACVANEASSRDLNRRVEANGKRDNVNGTPTFVINGKALPEGYQSLEELDVAIGRVGG